MVIGFAVQDTVYTTLQAALPQLMFYYYVILSISYMADWKYIKDHKEGIIQEHNIKENTKQKRTFV